MPKLTDREKLAELDKRQRQLAEEAGNVRKSLRARYGAMLADYAVETVSERDFREIIAQAIRAGGATSLATLKALPTAPS
ncbi:hypothetical protein [Sphingomonas sp. OTU376]|uniref:hypothetical protein n=1 Tax=Sphingomonas sp. OTU376 TaxID=3043863 RepID=UPI00313A879E